MASPLQSGTPQQALVPSVPITAPNRYLGRQPILDAQRRLFGYELFYRAGKVDHFSGDPDLATREVIDHWLLLIPDSTRTSSFVNCTRTALVEGLVIDTQRMRENLELTHGALFSQRVLLALVDTGLTRDDAYRTVQRLALLAITERIPLRNLLAVDPAGTELNLDEIFDYQPFVRYADQIVDRLDTLA